MEVSFLLLSKPWFETVIRDKDKKDWCILHSKPHDMLSLLDIDNYS